MENKKCCEECKGIGGNDYDEFYCADILCPCHLPSQNLTVGKKEVNSSELSKCCEKCNGNYGGGSTMLPLVEACKNLNCPCHQSPHQEPVATQSEEHEDWCLCKDCAEEWDKKNGFDDTQEPMEWVSELKKEPWYDGDEKVEKFVKSQIKQAEERERNKLLEKIMEAKILNHFENGGDALKHIINLITNQ